MLNLSFQSTSNSDITKPEMSGSSWQPERLVKLDDIAVEILKLVDGEATVDEISNKLSEKFKAPKEVIVKDVINMLQELSDKGFIEE
ncbi:MAG: pyrroloquinoline quinone biosynthesis peptide chaperone PqqD [Alphaproteobacteria bacterium]